MKAKELMIGDWVKITRRKKIGRVYRIDMANGEGNGWAAVIDGDYHESDLEPIPLTPEILEKNGFKTEDGVHFSIIGNSDILELLLVELPFIGYEFHIVRTERTINKCNQRCYIDRYFASIDYVHELQHALRLCRIEKEIIL